MLSISLGPIALPVAPLMLLLAVWVASWTATKLGALQAPDPGRGRQADVAGRAVLIAAGIGLLAARLAYLASHATPYLASPASALDLRDGGWHPVAGVAAGAAWLVRRGWQMPGSPWATNSKCSPQWWRTPDATSRRPGGSTGGGRRRRADRRLRVGGRALLRDACELQGLHGLRDAHDGIRSCRRSPRQACAKRTGARRIGTRPPGHPSLRADDALYDGVAVRRPKDPTGFAIEGDGGQPADTIHR